jgi:exonuclease VII large subunit
LLQIAIHSLKRTKPTIAVIHSRSQEAQVSADFCNRWAHSTAHYPCNRFRPTRCLVPELAHAIRTANADIIALIRGGGSDEQFSVFENPELLRA